MSFEKMLEKIINNTNAIKNKEFVMSLYSAVQEWKRKISPYDFHDYVDYVELQCCSLFFSENFEIIEWKLMYNKVKEINEICLIEPDSCPFLQKNYAN